MIVMQVGLLGSKLVSTLGNPSSKVPLAVKDVVNSLGFTYYSYDAGGKVEGKDRFIDEFGTEAIWLWGIPVFRKLIDKTAYKAAKLSPDVDVRVASGAKDYLQLAIENAPTEEIKKNITKASSDKYLGTFKKLHYGKFAAATALTLGAYFALTKIKQHITKKDIEKEYFNKIKNANNEFLTTTSASNPVFKSINENKQDNSPKPSFGAVPKVLESFMFDPVKNMLLIDAGITTERLTHSRTKGEFKEYAVKEGSFLFFAYIAGKYIQKGIEKISEKVFKKPIGLDATFLASDGLKDALQSGGIKTQLKDFSQNATDMDLLKFVFKNQDNIVVQAAKKAGTVKTVKVDGKDLIDTGKYISTKEMKKVAAGLEKLSDSFDLSKSKETVDKYLSKTKNLKLLSTAVNIGICCLALGIAVPKLIYKMREKNQNGSSEFHVKQEYEQQLAQQLQLGNTKV